MRLNWFRKYRKPPARGLGRLLRRWAPSWARSPVRRVVQTACLGLFAAIFLHVLWSAGPAARQPVTDREFVEGEIFLMLDPLGAVTAAIAARAWVWALAVAGAAMAVGLVVPRAFCGYVCPLGTLIDVSDKLLGRLARRRPARPNRTLSRVRFGVLLAAVVAAAMGAQLSGFVAAIPILTRGLHSAISPLQAAAGRGWEAAHFAGAAGAASAALLGAILLLAVAGRRFWCRNLCATGALLSLPSLLRLTGRGVSAECTSCGRCRGACSFAAVGEDFATSALDCTFCQECGGACPAGAIDFAVRPVAARIAPSAEGPAGLKVSRRGVLACLVGGAVVGAGAGRLLRAAARRGVLRPPGALPEERFGALCVRCGSCMRACPTGVLEPAGLEAGSAALWTPRLNCDLSGCDPECSNCTQVCPTGAIRPLTPAQKRAVRIGRAVVDEKTCLPHAATGTCELCHEACRLAGYDAIEFIRVGVEVDEQGLPVEDSGRLAPRIRPGHCVGCGLCQARCHAVQVRSRGALTAAAIRVVPLGKASPRPDAPAATQPGGGYVTDF